MAADGEQGGTDALGRFWVSRHRLTGWLGAVILIGGTASLMSHAWSAVAANVAMQQALLGGSIAAMATALGACPVLLSRRLSERWLDALLGFGAGVMLAACAFSLILPALEVARGLPLSIEGVSPASAIVGVAVLVGSVSMMAVDRLLPHEHFIKGVEGAASNRVGRTWLFVAAIALHNLPEGLAIGVGYANPEALPQANALALGIAIQDVPEGLVVAIALLAAGYRRLTSVAIGAASGVIEPIGAVLGAAVATQSLAVLPWGLGFAAGAMLFVISHEIIPESHRKGHERLATAGLIAGFVLMMMLDTGLG